MTHSEVVKMRPIQPDEGQRLKAIRLKALGDTPEAFGQTIEHASTMSDVEWDERARAGAAGQARMFLVAEDAEGNWVGMVAGRDDGGRADLVSMWVAPSHRRQGTGQALIRSLLDWAQARCVHEVSLFVGEANAPARALYTSMGFAPSGKAGTLAWNAAIREIEMVRRLG